jgi:hypothetical protein
MSEQCQNTVQLYAYAETNYSARRKIVQMAVKSRERTTTFALNDKGILRVIINGPVLTGRSSSFGFPMALDKCISLCRHRCIILSVIGIISRIVLSEKNNQFTYIKHIRIYSVFHI